MARSRPSAAECARALWLLGLEPPVDERDLSRAWRSRVSQAHPDLHLAPDSAAAAATLLTSALNDARRVVAEWIHSGRDWPAGGASSRPQPRPSDAPEPAVVCRHTGLRRGDLVQVMPDRGEPQQVSHTEVDVGGGRVWVVFVDGGAEPASRVHLAAYSCPVCGACAGPERERYLLRPCPDCLADLQRLERRPADARRIRSAIEARAETGRAVAGSLEAEELSRRAVERRRWARKLRDAGDEDLRAALLSAFSHAFERWAAPAGSTDAR
jgi:hypothetical protein